MPQHPHDDPDLARQLDAYQVPAASLSLQQRILAQAVPRPQPWRELLDTLGGWRVAGPAFAFSVCLGVATALWLSPASNDPMLTQESVWTMAGLDSSLDWTHE